MERAEGKQRKTRGVGPFQLWWVNNLDLLWGKKCPELKIFSNQLFSNRCQTHSIWTCMCPFLLVPWWLNEPSSMSPMGKKCNLGNSIHQRGGGCEGIYQWGSLCSPPPRIRCLQANLTSFPQTLLQPVQNHDFFYPLISEASEKEWSILMEIIACISSGGSEWAWHFAPQQSPNGAQRGLRCLCWPLLLVNTEE